MVIGIQCFSPYVHVHVPDKEQILHLMDKLGTLEMKWLAERDLLVKTQRELEHRHNSGE